jgi:hypothetical protein
MPSRLTRHSLAAGAATCALSLAIAGAHELSAICSGRMPRGGHRLG